MSKDVIVELSKALEQKDMEAAFTILLCHMEDEELAVPFEYLQAFVKHERVCLDWDFPDYYRNRLNLAGL